MNLTKVTKGGAIHFKLKDNRIGAIYPSGYVRVSTKNVNYHHNRVLMYQINKRNTLSNERIKVSNLKEAFNLLQRFEDKNCKDSSRVLTEGFKCDSSVVRFGEYHIDENRLNVFFNNNSIYSYSEVPVQVYNDFRLSSSKGKFLNETLKKFNFKRLTPAM